MNLIEALKKGKPFRRPSWVEDNLFRHPHDDVWYDELDGMVVLSKTLAKIYVPQQNNIWRKILGFPEKVIINEIFPYRLLFTLDVLSDDYEIKE